MVPPVRERAQEDVLTRFAIELEDDFSLAAAGEFLRGFTPAAGGAAPAEARLSLGFLLDGSFAPVAVALEQKDRRITGTTSGPAAAVKRQVERILSLDVDGSGWAALGRRDPVVGALQQRYRGFRAVCFPSPYEAALWGILAQRASMSQASRVKEKLAREHGAVLTAGGAEVIVPPPPQALLEMDAIAGLPDEKLHRLRGIAEAALAVERARRQRSSRPPRLTSRDALVEKPAAADFTPGERGDQRGSSRSRFHRERGSAGRFSGF